MKREDTAHCNIQRVRLEAFRNTGVGGWAASEIEAGMPEH